ncbi:MAG: hypothetical protein IOC54_01435 [Methylobacterium sp.]|nr:hypothetical protein [Methylobacterium sp.]MCA3650483.1 hypothetical protein [Methylobacterium sp.]MCA4923363.1 hypothetical protein [Methylobacterium sp.]
MKTSDPDEISIERLAEIIDVTPRWVRKHVEAGTITRVGRGKVSLKQAVRALIADAKRNADRDAEAASRATLNALRAKREELKLAIISEEFMPVSEANALLDEVVGVIRFSFEAMPARVAGNDWPLRRKIEIARDEALQAASARLEKMSQQRSSQK